MHIVDTPEPTNPAAVTGSASGPGDSGAGAYPYDPAAGRAGDPVVTPGRYETNVTTLTERIAIRLAGEGAEHPVAAAVTIAVRGMLRAAPADYAAELGLTPADVRALESGTVPLAELPQSLWKHVHSLGLEPVILVDLDRQLRGVE